MLQLAPRTNFQDKGSQLFNVKAYGAKGDATTNDATAIQAAITAAQAVGGVVFFPHGTFVVSSGLTVTASNVTLRGSGMGSSVILLANTVNANVISITGTGTIGVTIEDLTLNGNKANQTTGHGISINTPYSTTDTMHYIRNVDIISAKQDGIKVEGDTRVVRMFMVRSRYAGNNGFSLAGSDHQIYNAVADAANYSGFVIYASNCAVIGSKAFYCNAAVGGYSGFRVEAGRNFFSLCEAQDNNEHGFRLLGATGSTLVNCVGDSNGKQYAGAGSGLSIESTNNVSVVGGSYFDRGANTYPQANGIVISGTSTGCTVSSTTYYSNATSPYADSSSGANVHVNIGITTTASSATPTPTGNYRRNELYITAQAAAGAIAAPTGTANNGNELLIRIKDNGTARALTYNAIYRAVGVTLPSTTTISKTLYLAARYNSADTKWDVLAVGQEA